MTPLFSKRLAGIGVASYGVMWIFLVGALLALRDALAYAEAAMHGDIGGVALALRRALDLAQVGAPFGLLGYIMLFVAVIKGGARAPWIYRSGLAVCVTYLLLFPFGTIMGVCGIVHFRRRKQEYLRVTQTSPSSCRKEMTLPEALYKEIVALSKEGDGFAEDRRFEEALARYHAALQLLPEPREKWEAATWLLAAIGDAYYLSGHIEEAAEAFSHAMHCPDAIGNPFLHLRLGQCRLTLGDEVKAADELTRAYAMGGVEIFEKEDPRFIKFLDTKITR